MRQMITSLLKRNTVIIPVLAGLGMFFIAHSYEPSNSYGRGGPVGPDTDPILLGLGVALVVAAFVKYKRIK